MAARKKKSKSAIQPAWRPDFRKSDLLPDTKAIRTDFLLNFVAIAAAVVLAGYLGVKEFNIQGLHSAAKDLDQQIQEKESNNRRYLQLNGQYRRLQRDLDEVVDFGNYPLEARDLLVKLAEIRDPKMVLGSVTAQPFTQTEGRKRIQRYRLVIEGEIENTSNPSPSQIITDFQNSLISTPSLNEVYSDVSLTQFTRDEVRNIFNFSIEVIVNPEKKS